MSTSLTQRAVSALLGAAIIVAAPGAVYAQDDDEGFLGTVIIGESKRQVATDTATSTTTIDQEELEDRQGGTLAEVVDSVPGVTLVNGATSSGSGISIRGFGANGTFGTDQKVLIQVDGATKGGEELYRIGTQLFTDPFLYKSVRVIRGTIGSFEYGSGVIGGAVILETIDPSDVVPEGRKFAFRQVLEFSSNGSGVAGSSTLAYDSKNGLEVLFNYSRRYLKTRKDGNGNDIFPQAGNINDPSYLVKIKYTFGQDDAHSISFSYTQTDQSQRDVPYDTFANANFGNVNRDISNKTASLRYNFNPAGNDLIDFSIELTYADEEVIQSPVNPPSNLLDADNRYQTTTLRFKNTSLFTTGAVDHELRFGVEFIRRDRADQVAGSAPGGRRDIIAVYAIDELSVGGWTITPALRFEHQKLTGASQLPGQTVTNSALMGGLSIRYEFANGLAIFTSAAYTESLPILDDLTAPTRLRPEKSTTLEVGVSYDGGSVIAAGDNLSIKAVAYNLELRDVTSYGQFFFPNFVLLDKVERQGLEIELSYATESGWYTDAALNISRGDQFITNPATNIQTKSDWRLNPADSLRLTVGRKISKTWDLSWEGVFNKRYNRPGVAQVAGFGVHNLRATYKPQTGVLKGAEIRFSIENAFDKQYTPRLSTLPATGRNFKLTLAKTF
ncbi:MAG: TonB-dependent receptor plug domain-containing protein [Pseudomonadota bacterium]